MEPLFADAFANAGRVVLNILAIAGGFLIGNALTLVGLRIASKFVLKRKFNQTFEQALRVIGGIIVAFLVALIVFGDGGWGFGGSGGGRPGGPGGTGQQQPDETPDKTKADPKTKTETVPTSRIVVYVERATAFPKTFRFDGTDEAVDLETAKKRLAAALANTKGEVRLELKVYPESTAVTHPVVQEFQQYAHEQKAAVRVDKVSGE